MFINAVVAGNIGAGKSELVKRIEKLGFWAAYESVDDNPYLSLFYKNQKEWSFRLQIYFLCKRVEDLISMSQLDGNKIFDRSIYEDAKIFSRALYVNEDMSEDDYALYLKTYHTIVNRQASLLPLPTHLIYLHTSPKMCIKRVKHRGRDIEKEIDLGYLKQLDCYYQYWIPTFSICPVVIVDVDGLGIEKEWLGTFSGHKPIVIETNKSMLDKQKVFEAVCKGLNIVP